MMTNDPSTPDIHDQPGLDPAFTRRGFLRTAAFAGGGLLAVGLAACAPASAQHWTHGPELAAGAGASPSPSNAAASSPSSTVAPSPSMDHAPAASSSPAASTHADHDANAAAAVKRFLGGEGATLPQGNQPLEPTMDGDTKVFDLTIDPIQHKIDALTAPIAALGFNGTWPGPKLTVVEGDKIRAIFKNNLPESTGIHFHGQRLPNAMDGVPHITQAPIQPGESFTYEFEAKAVGSHMYHSHHNATDQVGRGLLGAFIVQPKAEADRYEKAYGASQDIVWISNDVLGGFTINGRGLPGHRADRREPRRHDRDPVHERGER